MPDLFPDSLDPHALGADLIPYLFPTFFAIYPDKRDLPAVDDWKRRVFSAHTHGSPRPADLLHVSVTGLTAPKRRLRPLREALDEAASHFSFPTFEIVFDTIGRFGSEARACVAFADAASQERFDALRIALANALRRAGLVVPRGRHVAHLTLGYANGLPDERMAIDPFGFRVSALDMVASEQGQSHHEPLGRWLLDSAP